MIIAVDVEVVLGLHVRMIQTVCKGNHGRPGQATTKCTCLDGVPIEFEGLKGELAQGDELGMSAVKGHDGSIVHVLHQPREGHR